MAKKENWKTRLPSGNASVVESYILFPLLYYWKKTLIFETHAKREIHEIIKLPKNSCKKLTKYWPTSTFTQATNSRLLFILTPTNHHNLSSWKVKHWSRKDCWYTRQRNTRWISGLRAISYWWIFYGTTVRLTESWSYR